MREVAQSVADDLENVGQTKRWLSDETGIPYPTLNRKIAGKSEFHFSELFFIAEALEVSPAMFTLRVFSRSEVAA